MYSLNNNFNNNPEFDDYIPVPFDLIEMNQPVNNALGYQYTKKEFEDHLKTIKCPFTANKKEEYFFENKSILFSFLKEKSLDRKLPSSEIAEIMILELGHLFAPINKQLLIYKIDGLKKRTNQEP